MKAISGLGTTIDVVLVNGHLRIGDTIIVAGQEGPIVTQVRGLLMPEPNKELRVRVSDLSTPLFVQRSYFSIQNQYQNYKQVKAARGIKIAAKDLEKSMAGLPLFVGRKDDEVEYFKREIETILKTTLSSIKLKDNGVSVQASTLGSLEALLEFLKTSNIPVSGNRKCSLNWQWANRDSSTLQSISDLSIDEISFEHRRNSNAMHSKTFSAKKIRCF